MLRWWGGGLRVPGPVAVLVMAALGLALVGAGATSASARTPSVTASCDSLAVSLTGYDNSAPNHVRVVVSSTTAADEDFGSGFIRTFPAPDRTVAFHYRVEVVAHDDPQGTLGFTTTYEGDSVPCAPAGPSPTLEVFANPATSAAAPTRVQPGSPINYTVRVGNTGGLPIADAPVVDSLPSGVTILPGTVRDGGAVAADGRSITWTVTLDPGVTRTLTFAVTVDEAGAPGAPLVNTVSFQGLTGTTTHQVPDGSLSLGAGVDAMPGQGLSVQPGDTLTYTFTVGAVGGLDQSEVMVTAYVPGRDPARPRSGHTTYVPKSAVCVGGGSCVVTPPDANGLITWWLGPLAAGTARQVTFQVTVDASASDGRVLPDILEGATASSALVPHVASGQLRTPITQVEAVHVGRDSKPEVTPVVTHSGAPEAATLPHTGGPLPVGPALGWAAAMIALGLLLLRAGHRRDPVASSR